MTYRGKIKGGTVVLEDATALPDGMLVSVEPLTQSGLTPEEPDALGQMADLAVVTGIPDLASNADHYLYGHPKIENAG
jgi:hypothetical protein